MATNNKYIPTGRLTFRKFYGSKKKQNWSEVVPPYRQLWVFRRASAPVTSVNYLRQTTDPTFQDSETLFRNWFSTLCKGVTTAHFSLKITLTISILRSGFLLENSRLDHTSRSCSTWVAVGDIASTSQLPSPHGGHSSTAASTNNQHHHQTNTPPPPAFTAADFIRSVNKKVSAHPTLTDPC